MKVAIHPRPTMNGAKISMRRARESRSVNSRSWCCAPGKVMAAEKVVVTIIWMIMVMIPMMPLESEILRVAERLRCTSLKTGSFQPKPGAGVCPTVGL